jgi:hypothetical protein
LDLNSNGNITAETRYLLRLRGVTIVNYMTAETRHLLRLRGVKVEG